MAGMTTYHRATSPQWSYIDGELGRRGLTAGDLVRGTGVSRSCLTAWRNGRPPSVPTARAVAAFLGVSTLEVLVGMRVMTAQEAWGEPVEVVDPADLTDGELFGELRERLRSSC
jgi:transcriptional regulator with XRE-family HTH domain